MAVEVKVVKRKRTSAAAWREAGGHTSSLRPRQVETPAPCGDACPIGTDVRGAMALVARHESFGRTEKEAFDAAWRRLDVEVKQTK